jgi:hypothetical protein
MASRGVSRGTGQQRDSHPNCQLGGPILELDQQKALQRNPAYDLGSISALETG